MKENAGRESPAFFVFLRGKEAAAEATYTEIYAVANFATTSEKA